MKILVINHEFPPIGGGAAIACAAISTYLARAHNKVEIVTSAFKGLAKKETQNGYVIHRIFSARKEIYSGRIIEVFLFIVTGINALREKMKKERPEVIFAFFTLPSGLLALFLKKMYKIPYSVFLRGIDVPGFQGRRLYFLNRIFEPLIKHIWVNADRVIANSEHLKELASKILKGKSITVIPNGVDTEFFYPPPTKKIKKNLKILFVGRLDPQKGLDYLLDAVSILNKKFPHPFIMEIVGDGPQKHMLMKKSARLQTMERMIFSGWIQRKDLLEKYHHADIFVTPSLDEGMPNTVLEAMACGLPIIASDIAAHRTLVEHDKNGLLVPRKNAELLAGMLIRLLKDESLRIKMGQENLQKVKDYRWKGVWNQIELTLEKK